MFKKFLQIFKKSSKQTSDNSCGMSECDVGCKINKDAEKLVAKIAENKLMQERLCATYNMMNTLLEAIPAPIFYKDVGGRYLGCNKYFERFLGLSRDEIIGKTVYEISPIELAKRYEAADKDLMVSGAAQRYITEVKYANGQIKTVMFHKSCFYDNKENLKGIVGVMLDITGWEKDEEPTSPPLDINNITNLMSGLDNKRYTKR